jgi:DDE_Tnp_1-associated
MATSDTIAIPGIRHLPFCESLSDPALHCAHPVLQRGLTSAHPAALNSLAASPPDVKFLSSVESRDDPRQQAKVRYPLDEILLLVLCAVLCGADGWVEIATWGKKKLDFLRHFWPYAYGTPSHDQLGIVFGALNAKQFQQCFIDWVSSLTKAVRGVVAVDGKTLRRAFDNGGEQG